MKFVSDPVVEFSETRQQALSTWDNEGGALESLSDETHGEVGNITNAELVLMRTRIIALENLMIAVLSEGSDRQLQIAREMAEYISPRPGSTQHPLTVHAAGHMTDITVRAVHYRKVEPQ